MFCYFYIACFVTGLEIIENMKLLQTVYYTNKDFCLTFFFFLYLAKNNVSQMDVKMCALSLSFVLFRPNFYM